MKCLYFFVALLIGILFLFAQAVESQPNIVFIIADDLVLLR
jgi:hypothetical protein